MNMKFFRTIGALATGVALCIPAAHGQSTKLFQPSAKQMQSIRKMLAGEKPQTKTAAKPRTLLPARFGGWARGAVRAVKPAAENAAALKEFGFKRGEEAEYSRGADKVAVRVMEFPDATGAYGAFTMLRTSGTKTVRIGPKEPVKVASNSRKGHEKPQAVVPPLTYFNGAYAGDHFLFWKGDLLVDATFAQPVEGEMAETQSLEAALPQTMGTKGIAPVLPEQLPMEGLDAGSVRYAIGPAGYQQEGGVLPSAVMDFDTDAEVVMARYGKGTLTLISYPTPEIAQAREAAIASVLKSGVVPGPKEAERVKRAGPLVAMTSGGFTGAEADALLKRVHFQGTVSFDQLKPEESEVAKTAKLLVGIASLTVILGLAAILLGFFLGGGRALYRVMRGKPASSVTDEEFIALDLNKPPAVRGETARDKAAGE